MVITFLSTGYYYYCSLSVCMPCRFFFHFNLQASIWHALSHYAYDDAIFLAERLFAEGNNKLIRSFHLWQPAPWWRLIPWLRKCWQPVHETPSQSGRQAPITLLKKDCQEGKTLLLILQTLDTKTFKRRSNSSRLDWVNPPTFSSFPICRSCWIFYVSCKLTSWDGLTLGETNLFGSTQIDG